jgi:hypothetical protein
MPTNVQNQQVLRAASGFQVSRPSSLVAQSLTSMFLITGGRILVKALYAKLTIATDASNATTITLGFTASEGAGANIANAIAASSIVGVVREIGTHWDLNTAVPLVFGALNIGATAATPLAHHQPFLLGPGTITYTGGVGVNPGSAAWYLNYLPLDSGVNVVYQ